MIPYFKELMLLTVEPWIQFCGVDQSLASEIRDSLRRAGVPQVAAGADYPALFGILCFSGIDLILLQRLHELRERPRSRVLALAASLEALAGGAEWRLLNAGASEVLPWQGAETAERIRAKLERWSTVESLADLAARRESMAGESPAWQSLLRRILEAARFSASPILLTGESGTGKELLARMVQGAGRGLDGAAETRELVTVDCSTIVPELAGSELFGHERGAFTGAHALREGAFALANGATLFLDEVGELPLALQAQLLRAIQEKTYKRVGGNTWLKTDFRLVCATNRDLAALVVSGQFRLDLYHRIAGWVFRTPGLEERREDILPLAQHFLRAIYSSDAPEFDDNVREYLVNRSYRGNIRELRQLVQRIAHRHVGPGPITAGELAEEDRPDSTALERAWPDDHLYRSIAGAIASGVTLREITTAASTTAIRIAVQSEQGNLQRAAKRLGVTGRALQLRRASGTFDE
ncbi:MAG TPA: sigma 54-interacting transcriptional regulator [Bryobacteraceae bacterium]|nr:sigma 54-interacting transcriptional regulator [Bryobacteraceae bacterium]